MKCLQCAKTFVGRIDKIFCSDLCRNKYNNLLNRDANNYIRNVNHTLRKNRRILEKLLLVNKFAAKEQLTAEGFNFNYFTGQTLTKNNRMYIYCYDFGYMKLESGLFLVVEKDKSDK